MEIEKIELKIPTSDGSDKSIIIRVPDDEDWKKFYRERRIVLDRSGSLEKGNLSIEKEFISSLVESGDFDEYEAAMLVKTLTKSEVISLEREGGIFNLRIVVSGIQSDHKLKIPTAKQLFKYQSLTVPQDIGRGRTRVIVNLPGAAEMYDQLAVDSAPCSILAKFQAISAVMSEFQDMIGGSENF